MRKAAPVRVSYDGCFKAALIFSECMVFLAVFLLRPADVLAESKGLKPPVAVVLPDGRESCQPFRYLIELAPYFKSSKTEEDTYALGVFISADITDTVELQFASDTVTYQSPDLGVSDIMFGLRWDFLQSCVSLAAIGYLELPTGSSDYAEAYAEPTLSIEASRGFGDLQASLTIGSTYLADSEDEDHYFNFSFMAELDYGIDESDEIGAQFSGYTPDQLEDGGDRIIAGVFYTRDINEKNSIGLTVLKGLSKRGTDWLFSVSYDYQF